MDELKGYIIYVYFTRCKIVRLYDCLIVCITLTIKQSYNHTIKSKSLFYSVCSILYFLGMLFIPQLLNASSDTLITIPIPIITANNPVCENATLKLETAYVEGLIYHWYDLNGNEISVVATAILPAMELSMAGEYSLIIELNGCFSERAKINIEVITRPDTPFVFNNGPLCEGETLLLDGPNLANTTYKWIDPFGTVISTEEDVSITNIPKELAGDYFLEITQFDCMSPLGGTDVGIIAINEIPELIVSGPACEGDSLLIKGPHIAGANYIWSGPYGFESNQIDSLIFPSVSATLSGTFNLTLEAEGCKSPEGTIEVIVQEKPAATLTGGGNICQGDSLNLMLNLTGTAPFELIYTVNEEEQRPVNTSEKNVSLIRTPSAAENYSIVKMNDATGCRAIISGSAAVQVFEKPKIQLISDTICDAINENYQLKVKIKNGMQPYEYQGLNGGFADSVFTSVLINNESPYSFQVIDENNCLSNQLSGQYSCPCSTYSGNTDGMSIAICGSDTAEILHLNDEQLDANDQLFFVLHDSTTIDSTTILTISETSAFNYNSSLKTNHTYYVSPIAGNRQAQSIDFSDRCLSIGKAIELTFLPIPPKPTLAGEQQICPGASLELTTENIEGEIIYSWETPIEIIETTTPTLIIDPIDSDYSGDFRLRLIQDGCRSLPSNEYSIEVTIPSGQADAGKDTISCGNPIFHLDAKTPDFGFGNWTVNSGAYVKEPNNPKSEISSLQEGPNVFYWMLSTVDCPNFEMDSVLINYRSNALAINDEYILEETATTIDINVLDNDITPDGYTIWIELFRAPHQGILSHEDKGNFTYRRPFNGFKGNVVFDYLLCFETPTCPTLCDTASVTIDILLNPLDPSVYVPDGITPNNDGVNDRLIIEGIENHEKNELVIFDRWGNKIFHAKPYKNSWNGTYNNMGLPEGTYYYVLKTDVTNKKTLKGRLYIIR